LDKIIEKLVKSPTSKISDQLLTEPEISYLISECRSSFLRQSGLLELRAPIKIVGDIHGQFRDLRHLFDICGAPPKSNYLFLGDYVDRGKQSIETICLLFAFKLKYPNNFFLLRGNHECENVNKIYGFYDECKRRYSNRLYKRFISCFDCIPVASLVESKILCMHGGLSPDLKSFEEIKKINRPTKVPDQGLLCDLLWSDPQEDHKGWGNNDRGVSFTFGEDIVDKFLEKHDIELICRAHQVVDKGYKFFGNNSLVTIFSAPNYCGEYENYGAVMDVTEDLVCSFKLLKPTYEDVDDDDVDDE